MPVQWITTDSLAKYTQIPDLLITTLNSRELLFVCMKWPVFKRILYGNYAVNDFQRLHMQCKALQHNIFFQIIDQFAGTDATDALESSEISGFKVEIYNQQGNQLILLTDIEQGYPMDVGNLPNGLYYARFYNGQAIYHKTLQVNH